ncbi:hypothetical protein [Bosea sp. LjRoot237]|uniref:hypothetical protein n=1 Tax=Bosea sp. LjRoot237 TaxID=3342292 RepID=UPI003ED14F6B
MLAFNAQVPRHVLTAVMKGVSLDAEQAYRAAKVPVLVTHGTQEFLRAKQGVGYITFYYWEVLNPEKMYADMVVVMLLGVTLTYGLQWLQRRLMPWQW